LQVWVVLSHDTPEQRRSVENGLLLMETRWALDRLIAPVRWSKT
jgi:hypothetical protein